MSEIPERLQNALGCSMAIEIIRNRIRTTVCIDDDYKGAYGEVADDFEKNLYQKLTESGCRFVSMQSYPFTEKDSCAWIKEADLLILDWKLTKDGENEYVPALELLDNVIGTGSCSLICIYTDEKDPDEIFNVLETYFIAGNYNGVEAIREDVGPFIIEKKEELLSLAEKVNGKAETEDVLTNAIIKIVEESSELRKELRGRNRWNEFWQLRYVKEVLLFELFNHHHFEGVSSLKEAEFDRLYTKDNKTFAIRVNNRFITIMGKHDSQGNHVKPEDLISQLAEAVYNAPDHLYHLLHLKYQAEGRKAIEAKSAFIDVVPDGILKKLLYKHNHDSESLDREFREHFMEDTSASMILRAERLDTSFIEAIEETSSAPSNDQLLAFNAYYSQVLHPLRKGRKVGFGDIFEIINYDEYVEKGMGQYLLCITAHCDCANATEKTKNRYCFHFAVGGIADNLDKALKKAETTKEGLIDFVRKPDGECVAIKWDDYLVTLYLSNSHIEEDGIKEVVFKKEVFSIRYVGTLKEQYAERVANSLFSYARRVGITYLGRKDGEKKEVTS